VVGVFVRLRDHVAYRPGLVVRRNPDEYAGRRRERRLVVGDSIDDERVLADACLARLEVYPVVVAALDDDTGKGPRTRAHREKLAKVVLFGHRLDRFHDFDFQSVGELEEIGQTAVGIGDDNVVAVQVRAQSGSDDCIRLPLAGDYPHGGLVRRSRSPSLHFVLCHFLVRAVRKRSETVR
jgi:hypothetical protein